LANSAAIRNRLHPDEVNAACDSTNGIAKLEYLKQNPVTIELVNLPAAYYYSSARIIVKRLPFYLSSS